VVDHSDSMNEGIEFLESRGLLAQAGNGPDGSKLYGITGDGLTSIYLLSLVMASGITLEELKGTEQAADARQVAQCASALVRALDEISMDPGEVT